MSAVNVYTITVGNTEVRKGHRANCAQCLIEFDVAARSTEEAVRVVKEQQLSQRDNTVIDPVMMASDNTDPFIGIFAMRVRINRDTINERTVGIVAR